MKIAHAALALLLLAASVVGCGGAAQLHAEAPAGDDFPEAQPALSADEVAVPATLVAAQDEGAEPVETGGASSEVEPVIAGEPGDVPIGVDQDSYADTDPAALTDFRATLDPYGAWVDDGTYGTVWVPSTAAVGSDFSPYVSAGHWAYDTDYVWVSDYSWGWAPFHYGRWVYIAGSGWAWIPGRTYAGAWVSWRYGYDGWGGYVGWAPLPPAWYWRGGYAVGIGYSPYAPYGFCHHDHLFSPHVGPHMVRGPQVNEVAAHTRPYVPANPTVNGSASGTGGIGGHSLAHPTVGGPPPASLGIASHQIVRPTPTDRTVITAQQYARPSTAQPLGGSPPQHAFPNRYATTTIGRPAPGGPVYSTRPFGSLPSYRQSMPSATAPQFRGVAPTPYRTPQPTYRAPQPSPGGQQPVYRSPPAYSAPQPTYRAPQPAYRSPPSYSTPQPAYRAPQPVYRSPPSYSAPQPAYRAPAPTYRPSTPSPSYRSAPSGGGGSYHPPPTHSAPSFGGGGAFRGGGGGGRSGGGGRGGGHR